jgi:diacylglycerol kinase (ATP)
MDDSSRKAFVVFNPTAGKEGQADEVRAALARHFVPPRWMPEIYETTGEEDIAAICRAACERGASLVIVAGGDGTLVGVANGLVHSPVPLGIIPLGTGNDLARALLIPLKIDEAVELLAGDHAVIEVDALQVGERCYFSNVGVGMSPAMMNDTSSAAKKHLGRLAYVMTMIRRASIFRLHRYTLTLDGRARSIRAAEVMISNTTLLRKPPLVFGAPETLGDGQFEVYVLTARWPWDYLRLVWDMFLRPGKPAAKLSHWVVKQSARIDAVRRSSMVQADGEVIGRTPVEIKLVPKALHVIVPTPAPVPAAS